MSVPVPCRIDYTVRHKGEGNNTLRVRFGNFLYLVWAKVHDFEVEAGKSTSRDIEIRFDDTGRENTKQDVRWRLSRGALTKAIDWDVTYTVTRLEGGTDATEECEPTITNDE